jgi:predicted RNA-binding Zn-ribbon protein involved in translation (DUF1610 family)
MSISVEDRGRNHCNGKQSFVSPHLARKIIARDRRRKGGMNVYRCRECGQFHIGHSKGSTIGWKYRS